VVTLHHLAQAIGVSPVDLIKPDAEALREPQTRRTGNKNRKSRRSGVTDLGLCAKPAVSGEDGQQEALVVAAYFNADATQPERQVDVAQKEMPSRSRPGGING